MRMRGTALGVLGCCFGACGGDGLSREGSVRVELRAEQTVVDGLRQGDGSGQVADYAVRYDKYIVAVGDLFLARGERERHDEQVFLVDLKRVGSEGVELSQLDNLASGQWSEFSYATPVASSSAARLAGVSEQDAARMAEEGWTYWIEGVVERSEAEGGPVRFVIQVDAPTRYTECGLNGELGLSVVEGQTTSAIVSLHGDHLWFTGFNLGSEASIERRAGYLVALDEDGDGAVSTQDLARADALEFLAGYDFAGAPGGTERPIDSVLDYVRAQLSTQGHFMGEGECLWQVGDAVGGHDHDP